MVNAKEFWEKVAEKHGLRREKMPSTEKFWSAKSMDTLIPKNALVIGQNLDTLSKTCLDLNILKTHLHVLGSTNTGKSCFLEVLIHELILKGHGLCVIDPHGSLYDHIVNFLSCFPKLAEKVILFNPAKEQSLCCGFNPLKRWNYFSDLTVQVRYLTAVVAKVWEEDSKKTPLLRKVMGDMLYPLIEQGFTFLEAEYFTELPESEPRKRLVEFASLRRVRKAWEEFEKYSLPRKQEILGSLQRRIPEFVDNNAVRMVLGRTENTLDFEDIFENQKILLCNLSQIGRRLHQDDSFMLGTLLISEMASYALSRDEETVKQTPFFLVIDEFQNFITPDIASILDQCRKYGLHMVLSHQRLAQLKIKDPDLYDAVKNNARTKIVFSISFEDAEIVEKEMFPGEHNLKEIKDQLYRTAVLEYREELRRVETGARATGEGKSKQKFSSEGLGDVGIQSLSETIDPNLGIIFPLTLRQTKAKGSSASRIASSGQATGQTRFYTDSEGWSEVPIIIPILGKELASRQFYNLEEQRYKKATALTKQPIQHAFVKILENPTQRVKIKTVLPFPKDKIKIKATEEISYQSQSRYYLPAQKVKASIIQRQALIEAEQHDANLTQRKEPKKFGTSAPIHLPKKKKTKL